MQTITRGSPACHDSTMQVVIRTTGIMHWYDALKAHSIWDLQVDSVDDTAALAIEEMLAKAAAAGKRFIVCGASAQVMAMFTRLGMHAQMAVAPDVSRQQALEAVLA